MTQGCNKVMTRLLQGGHNIAYNMGSGDTTLLPTRKVMTRLYNALTILKKDTLIPQGISILECEVTYTNLKSCLVAR